jgi:PmbA protein
MKNGVINTFYYDIISANKLGVKSTGNGKRGWCIPPSPVPNNLIIKGDIGTENLLDILDHGILIDYIVSDGRTDVINGIFYGSIKRGNYIRGGKKVSSVSGINVCIDFNKTLQKGAVFGNDDTWIGGEFCSPSLLLNGVEIIG